VKTREHDRGVRQAVMAANMRVASRELAPCCAVEPLNGHSIYNMTQLQINACAELAIMTGRGGVAKQVSLSLAPWIAAIALWYGVRLSGYVNESLIPAPHRVAAKFVELLLHEGLLYDVFASTRRVFFGVALGITAAVPVGFLLAGIARRGRSPIP